MTNEYAPEAIQAAFDRLAKAKPAWGLVLGGILGSSPSHTYGYHRSRNWASRWSSAKPDYSIQLADDQAGDGDAASALDITPRPRASAGFSGADVMVTMTRRLIRAVEANDPRLRALREFFGTVNGTSVTGRDVRTGRVVSADSSHLWHLHLSGFRRWADDPHAWAQIVDVIAGAPLVYPPDDERWTETVTKDEVTKLIDERIRDGLQAVEFGGDHGVWDEAFAGRLHTDPDRGDRDRLAGLEQRVEALEK